MLRSGCESHRVKEYRRRHEEGCLNKLESLIFVEDIRLIKLQGGVLRRPYRYILLYKSNIIRPELHVAARGC